ncbi:3-oxoacyl-[acyl-carrier-protein] synthase III C-terminal domain-containing protein [Streptomyces sp. SP17BM10]|uniref:3-oxoacyl-ACP synthase III family protein n=1 Tax=Streptomyces sp. SP17BM10 TaxID=3002530 RepID=UPI002E781839|nr:3-oxoacyl-[acyl-carrier-protein] synthase III C-terminal domain-containing protein [Streptomyces sp. SP17BM10]MEE1784669.1 3-oxoacyl-[acyl-carrier-protein] synthase III C-terminal domain-containing protein [Streptomyces sp. SP17BM10]
MSFGIVSLAHTLGEPVDVDPVVPEFTADVERVRSWGYRRFHRAADGVGLTDLAVEAGRLALERAAVAASEVDLVVLAMSDLSEYLYWDAAASTAARLEAYDAEAVLLGQACGGGVAAFDLVGGRFATHPDYDTALIIGANRVCEPYWNRMEINTSIFSDGAAAAVVRRDHPRCRWMLTETLTDGRYADFMRMETGGAARPFGGGDHERPRVLSPTDRLQDFFADDLRRMFAFVSTIRNRNREIVERACARAGIAVDDLARLLHFHDNVNAFAELAKDLGLPLERTNTELAAEHGHVGCADQLLSLERQLAAGELAEGDIVALTSTGSGMHWLCTLLTI